MFPIARTSPKLVAEPYSEHIEEMFKRVLVTIDHALSFSPSLKNLVTFIVGNAVIYHDLGKLLQENQDALYNINFVTCLPIPHMDSGVAYFLDKLKKGANETEQLFCLIIAIIIRYHHGHLKNLYGCKKPLDKLDNLLRYYEYKEKHHVNISHEIRCRNNQELDNLLKIHHSLISEKIIEIPQFDQVSWALFIILCLSFLVDADYSDAARIDGDYFPPAQPTVLLKPNDRLRQLDQYVKDLPFDKLKTDFYNTCRNSPDKGMMCCDGAVGIGKTTAIMAKALKLADETGANRIFIIQPYTSLLIQTYQIYRKALVLPDETEQQVIAEYHCNCDFKDPFYSKYCSNYALPLTLTTSVQFFTSLLSDKPFVVRKNNRIINSVIYLDDCQALMPVHLWPVAFQVLEELVKTWRCHVIFGSGTLDKFWEIPEIISCSKKLPKKLPNINIISKEVFQREIKRVKRKSIQKDLHPQQLIDLIFSVPGSRVLIVNTKQIAAYISDQIRKQKGIEYVEHISDALTTKDQKNTLYKVHNRLKNPKDNDWVLVATTSVECGHNMSFHNGFRQRCTPISYEQTSGRIRRNWENWKSTLYDFDFSPHSMINENLAFNTGAMITKDMFKKGKMGPQHSSEYMKKFIEYKGMKEISTVLKTSEDLWNFQDVAEGFTIIPHNTVKCVIDPEVANRIRKNKTYFSDTKYMVEIYDYQIQKYNCIQIIPKNPNIKLDQEDIQSCLWEWRLKYDNFIGFMAGILPLLLVGEDQQQHQTL